MSIYYLNYFPRISTSASFSFRCNIHRRYYADRKSLNHYDALGINSNASAKEIKSAFYKLSKKHHPDVNPDDKHASNKFSTISNAYDILNDPVKRRDYDNELSSHTTNSDPYVTYNRQSTYAQRARAHRPSAWKPPASSGGFQGSDNAFGNSRNTTYGTFDKEKYDSTFGRYRGPLPKGRSNVYDFDEFYRAHYSDFQNWSTSRKQAQEKIRYEREQEEAKRQDKANRTVISKFTFIAVWLSLGLGMIFLSTLLHDMNFRQPSDEFRTQFYLIQKSPKNKSQEQSSTKT